MNDISHPTPAAEAGAYGDLKSYWQRTGKRYAGIVCGLLVLLGLFACLSPNFFTAGNLLNIVLQVSTIGVIAFGMTYVLLLGDIDLSVGSIIALAGSASGLMLAHGVPLALVLPSVLVLGGVLGALNGALSALFSIPSFIVTVATMGIFRGVAYITTDGLPVSIDNDAFLWIGNGVLLGVPIPIWILAVLLVVNHFVLAKTVFGRKSYLAGGNPEAAVYAGINVKRLRITIFMLSGVMAAIGGVMLTSRLYSAQPNAAIGWELDAIAAAVLGGTSLSGGYGTVVGTLIGALIIGVINNGMNLLSVAYFYQLIVKGVVILVAVCIDVQSKKRRA